MKTTAQFRMPICLYASNDILNVMWSCQLWWTRRVGIERDVYKILATEQKRSNLKEARGKHGKIIVNGSDLARSRVVNLSVCLKLHSRFVSCILRVK